jgi:hypothetical protein
MLIRTTFVLINYVTNLRRCICGSYFIIFHCACAWTFLCFSIYRWTLLALYGFLLCRPLNVCDHEVTAVKKWRTSTCFKLFFRVLRWYFTNREASVNAWAGVLLLFKCEHGLHSTLPTLSLHNILLRDEKWNKWDEKCRKRANNRNVQVWLPLPLLLQFRDH